MKGLIYTILIIIILAIAGIIFLGRGEDPTLTTPEENTTGTPSAQIEDMIIDEVGTTTGETTEHGPIMREVKVFDVEGVNFAFSQTEVRVKKGDRVRINFTSTDGFHDWVLDEFNAATERISSGGETFVEFTADEAGEFEYYCSVGSHRALGMVGTLIVE